MPTPLNVMISSTSQDLPEHRQQVMNACLQQGMFPMMMEHLPASDAEAIPASLKMVDEADIYLLILANRYGYVPAAENPEQISVTEHEYNRALKRKIPCLTFAMHADHHVKAGDVETGEGAVKLEAFKARALLKGTNFFRSPDDLRGHVVNSLSKFVTFQADSGPQPLIHSLPTQQEIEGREAECTAIVRAMSLAQHQVYVFTAPGGFGKTALLSKVVRILSPDDVTLLDKIELTGGERIEPHISALLHVDCRKEVKMGDLFANAGRLIGEQQAFETIYNADGELTSKLQENFRRLSTKQPGCVWFVFDNFESMLNNNGEVAAVDLRAFFGAVFAAGHHVRALIVGREVPKFSRRERPEVLEAVADGLFDGLPLQDCVEFLKKNDGARDLTGLVEDIESVLKEFAIRVHRIPLALVWAVGYLQDTTFTLKEILKRSDLFADFDKEQAKDADSYENKGVKRLHYEQLKIQPPEYLPVLQLLAFFKRPVPRGVLAHLMDEIELSKALARLEQNRLITHKESPHAHTRFINDPLAVNLYGLHPVICENKFFDTQADQEKLFETAASACWTASDTAHEIKRFAYVFELADCAQELYAHLVTKLTRGDLLNTYAHIVNNKGLALWNLTRLNEALVEFDRAIEILERLVNEEQRAQLANGLAMLYMNRAVALSDLNKLNDALTDYDKAIAIRERLVNEEQQTDVANELAMAYMNKGVALRRLTKLPAALGEYNKAIAIYERLVDEEKQMHFAINLATAYMNKGNVLSDLGESLNEALGEYDKAIAIYERQAIEEQQTQVANDLARAYLNKSTAFSDFEKLNEALGECNKAIAIYERLVDEEHQTQLANELATAYMNKAVALQKLKKLNEALAEFGRAVAIYERLINEEQQIHLASILARVYLNKAVTLGQLPDFQGALTFYEKSVTVRRVCVDDLKMYWLMPDLLKVIGLRVMTLIGLELWAEAASDVREYLSRCDLYLKDGSIDPALKEKAQKEAAELTSRVRNLTSDQREFLYVELGAEAERLKSLVDIDSDDTLDH